MMENDINKISSIVMESILFEVSATPKPGLVDRENCGAHLDMDYFTFMTSASALSNSFYQMVQLGMDYKDRPIKELLKPLRQIGVEAENRMFKMTKGVNTHKGMIFTLGVLSACAGWAMGKVNLTSNNLCDLAAKMCYGISKEDYKGLEQKDSLTKGEHMYIKYGLLGVRGEVESGYKTVRDLSLPIYTELRNKDININDALVQTILHLISNTKDTNIISRHDMNTAKYAKELTEDVLKKGGILAKDGYEIVKNLDYKFIDEYISPGGCADLLAVTHFLYTIERALI